MPSRIMTVAAVSLIFVPLVSLRQIRPSCVLICKDVPGGYVLVTGMHHVGFQLIALRLLTRNHSI
jgi:hypothetical protein